MSGIDGNAMLVLHCDGVDGATSFPDASLNPKTVVANGPAQVDTAQFKFGTASYLGDGATAFLSSADNADYEFRNGDFTLDCWVRFNSIPVGNSMFISKYTTAGAQRCFFWCYDQATAAMQFRYSADGSASTLLTQAWSPSLATWYHIAVVRFGLSVLMFVDGTQIGTTDAISGALFNGTADLNIGAFNAGTGGWLDGWLDEIRISNIARWAANFTPPSAPYSADVAPTTALAWRRA